MSRVVVLGAGIGGLATALAFGRDGHEVVVLERDATPLPPDPQAAFSWDRQGAPQVRHSHAFLARLRNLLRDRFPDVLADLLAAGATEIDFATMLPPAITDRGPRPGDEDLVALACRRTTFEWVLRRAALAGGSVTLLDGVTVQGFVGTPAHGGRPAHVTGVQGTRATSAASADDPSPTRPDPVDTDPARPDPVDTDPARPDPAGPSAPPGSLQAFEVTGDLVVAANGRRAPLPAWLQPLGVELDERADDTGIVYLSRFYRLRDDAVTPATDGPIGGDLGYLKYAVFQGDNRTFSATFAVRTDDAELRTRLRDPDGFDRAARALPATQAWAADGLADPITDVEIMARLLNRRRRFTVDGAPLVRGLAAVGDAHTCTNPLYGRGCSLAVWQATLLADAWADHHTPQHRTTSDHTGGNHTTTDATTTDASTTDASTTDAAPSDLRALAAYEAASVENIEPWYHASVASDRQGAKWAERERQARRGEPTGDLDADPDTSAADLLRHGLMPAVRTDPDVFRAFLRGFNLLTSPQALMADPALVTRVLESYQARDERPPEDPLGPPRSEMMATLTA